MSRKAGRATWQNNGVVVSRKAGRATRQNSKFRSRAERLAEQRGENNGFAAEQKGRQSNAAEQQVCGSSGGSDLGAGQALYLLLHFFRRFETQNVNAYIQNLQCQGNQRNERPQGRFILF